MSDSKRRAASDRKPKHVDERGRFAAQIARAEFGRFYWSGEQASRLEEAMRKPKLSNAKKSKQKS